MSTIYHDADADLGSLAGETVAVVGYGNQGRAQALNLRDSGLRVVIGNIRDAALEQALGDGFEVLPIADACAGGGRRDAADPGRDHARRLHRARGAEPARRGARRLRLGLQHRLRSDPAGPRARRRAGRAAHDRRRRARDVSVEGSGFPSFVACTRTPRGGRARACSRSPRGSARRAPAASRCRCTTRPRWISSPSRASVRPSAAS